LRKQLLEWTEVHAPAGVELMIRNEALTDGAQALYASRGFEPRMVETRMVRDTAAPAPEVPLPSGVETRAWSQDSALLFFAAYRASFADRPGFPDPPAQQWVDGLAGEELQPHLSHVALAAGEPVGFVTARLAARGGWIDQIGVAPAWNPGGGAGRARRPRRTQARLWRRRQPDAEHRGAAPWTGRRTLGRCPRLFCVQPVTVNVSCCPAL
jgi:hypothetical protein